MSGNESNEVLEASASHGSSTLLGILAHFADFRVTPLVPPVSPHSIRG